MRALHFLTWSTYGSWLPGDQRGWASRHTRSLEAPSWKLEQYCRRLAAPPVTLDDAQRIACAAALEDACAFRAWDLHALNVRSRHAHALVGADTASSRVVQALKARSARRLRELGLVTPDRPVWASGASTRVVAVDGAAAVIDYILSRQGPNLPGAIRGGGEATLWMVRKAVPLPGTPVPGFSPVAGRG